MAQYADEVMVMKDVLLDVSFIDPITNTDVYFEIIIASKYQVGVLLQTPIF